MGYDSLMLGLRKALAKTKELIEENKNSKYKKSYFIACHNTITNLIKFLKTGNVGNSREEKNEFLKNADRFAKRALMYGYLTIGENYRVPWFVSEILTEEVIEQYKNKYIDIPEYTGTINRFSKEDDEDTSQDYVAMPNNDLDIDIKPDAEVQKAVRQHILKATIEGWKDESDIADFYSGNHSKLIKKGYTIGQLQSRANKDSYKFNFNQPIMKPKIWNRLEIRTQPEVVDILRTGTEDEIMDLVITKRFRPNILCKKAEELGVYDRLPEAIKDPDALRKFTQKFQQEIMQRRSSKQVQEAVEFLKKKGYKIL